MPTIASIGELLSRLAGGAADVRVQLAAVGVAIERVVLRANVAARWSAPPYGEDMLNCLPAVVGVGVPVWGRRRFEHHDAGILRDAEDVFVQRAQKAAVVVAGPQVPERGRKVSRRESRLIQRVDADDVRILVQRVVHLAPEADQLIFNTKVVVEESTLDSQGLHCLVVCSKVNRLAVFNQRQALIVLPPAIVLDRLAVSRG